MLFRVKLTVSGSAVPWFEGSAMVVSGSAPDVITHSGMIFVRTDDQAGDGVEFPFLYRLATCAPAIPTPTDGAEGS